MTTKTEQLRGLQKLIETAVDQGTSAVERVHRATAARPFAVLDAIPAVSVPSRGVRLVHDAILDTVYASIRGVNHVVGSALSVAIDAAEGAAEPPPPAPATPADPVLAPAPSPKGSLAP
jgi:hypothetical protein